ncbi:NADH-quinone oxidoreductase subunit NuoH [Thermoproteus tenax]|uniref:NADH dehydrogenase I chain H n=1 Tax=Thermoproteus tenax (strain ATCC 35583 / DSM 2078 / JCM 9277 / NBRC 100435 / Kra 1) TaxID=768679 RepID=G4RNS8_THETK|nr:NADH-quinone oxidoreductase subunit NuoH [Thermoproteus tenax]CCC81222.1 NADH dehydrogenase I chain H [Thermoproteus tenax Kra 1]
MDISSLLLSPRLWDFLVVSVVSTLILLTVVWAERKIAARVQMRVGPFHISPKLGGYLQLVADGIRFVMQEVIIPVDANKILFVTLPPLFVTLALIPDLLVPLSPYLAVLSRPALHYGIVMALAVLFYLFVIVVGLGWAVNNRFAYIGAAREALIITAYEIPLLDAFGSMFLTYKTIDPIEIVSKQTYIVGAIYNPLAFIVYIIGVAMATSRFPFEIADYEGDVATGPYSDFSSIFLALTYAGGIYIALFSYALLGALVFLGGWAPIVPGPWPGDILGNLAAAGWVLLKTLALMIFFVFLRSVMPVARLDHTLSFSWKWVLLIALAATALSAAEYFLL